MTTHEAASKPEILIVGAGVAGLIMGIMLEQIGIPYRIFERSSAVKPLGSAMSLGGTTFPVLEQLGIYDELKSISKEYTGVVFRSGDCKQIGAMDFTGAEDIVGYKHLAFSRPDFHTILHKRIPAEKIYFSKKIIRTEEVKGKVTIYCADETSFTGDILVGADGAYSGVRQSLYKKMEEDGKLPKSDKEGFSVGYTVVVGIAKPTDFEKFPAVKEMNTTFEQIVYNDRSNCYAITLPDNRVSWGFGTQLQETIVKNMQFRNAEWRSDDAEASIKDYRHFPSPVGGTMGDLFDATPKELISKVYLEEKLFKTWHHGHTVLLGDGAANAIYDSVVLANHLYSMKDTSDESIKAAFSGYYSERFKYAKKAFEISSGMAKVLNGQKFSERLARNIVLNYVPNRFILSTRAKNWNYRPQVCWLPLIKDRGTGEVLPQHFETHQ
ncbi:hypothetical protein BGZ76_003522 [Entomortierella beljakovae]|nr:hypothetical protein BGZ76_003522 [Entomortierella beljakovae]